MLTDAVLLDISQAQRQIDQLEAELRRLSQPIKVPIDIEGGQAADELRRDFQGADTGVSNLNAELAETDRELDRVRNSADRAGRELDQAGRKGTSAFNGMAVAAGAFGVALAAAAGIRAFVGFAGEAIDAASNLAESTSKAGVVFGGFTDEVKQFAAAAPQALGLSTQAALEATATFGNLFVALGLTQQAAADMSPDIVQLAADLASFNNLEVGDALEKLRSGLVGEAEPLRSLGVAINEAAVSAKALELGLVGSNGEISEAAKVQARYALILEQTTTAQGDFARTADGVANTQRTLSGEWQNAKAALGEALLPAFKTLLGILPGLVTQVGDLAPTFGALAVSMAAAAESAGGFLPLLLDILRVLPTIPATLGGFFTDDQSVLQTQRVMQTMIETIRAGGDPTDALTNSLAELGRIIDDPSQLALFAEQLVRVANVPQGNLDAVTRVVIEQGEAVGLDTERVLQLVAALNALNDVPPPKPRQGSRGGGTPEEVGINNKISKSALERAIAEVNAAREAANARRIFEESIGDEANALEILGAVADQQQTSIFDLLAVTEQLTPVQQAAAASLSASTVAYLEQVDAIDEVKAATGTLPGAISAAGDAIRNEQGKIVDDLDTFFADLRAGMAENAEFDAGLAILRALGLDALADSFAAQGLEAGELLKDAIADPVKAGLLDAQLKGLLRDQGKDITSLIAEGIEGQPITQGLIDSLTTAAAQADTPEVRNALLDLAETLNEQLHLTPVIDSPAFSGSFASPELFFNVNATGFNPPAGSSYEFNFYGITEKELPSTAERAVQIITRGTALGRTGPQ